MKKYNLNEQIREMAFRLDYALQLRERGKHLSVIESFLYSATRLKGFTFLAFFDRNLIHCQDTHSFVNRLFDKRNEWKNYGDAQEAANQVIRDMRHEWDKMNVNDCIDRNRFNKTVQKK